MGYFSKSDGYKDFIKILVGIIAVQLIAILIAIKSLISVAENKTVVLEVPQFLESGKYRIGASFASENVYKMWVKVWVQDIANFSYQNIEEKFNNIYPFLDKDTAFKSKQDIQRFIEFVKTNYVQQKFKISDIVVKKLNKQYVKVIVYGTVYRKIGGAEDSLNGLKYAYEFITYVRNGQIYIKSIKTSFYALSDVKQKNILNNNKYVNFDDVLQ